MISNDGPNLFTQPRSQAKPLAEPALAQMPQTLPEARDAGNPEEMIRDRILDTDERYAHVQNKNFMGSLFREKGWHKTGRIIKSKTQGSHANELKCWRWITPEKREKSGGER